MTLVPSTFSGNKDSIMGLKVDTIQNPSSATVNLTLDTSGNVAVGNNMTVAGTSTFTGSLGNITAGTVTASGLVTGATGALYPIVNGTAQASTSGTSITFTGIPSWVKRVTVNISGVSTSGTSNLRFRIGPVAGVETSGYLGSSTGFAATTLATVQFTAGFDINDGGTAAAARNGSFVFSLLDAATNTWSMSGTQGQSNTNIASFIGGSKPLAGALSVLSVTTTNGTDTFDAGTINIQYE